MTGSPEVQRMKEKASLITLPRVSDVHELRYDAILCRSTREARKIGVASRFQDTTYSAYWNTRSGFCNNDEAFGWQKLSGSSFRHAQLHHRPGCDRHEMEYNLIYAAYSPTASTAFQYVLTKILVRVTDLVPGFNVSPY